MTHRFARQLDVAVEFLPVRSHSEATQRVNSGYCDVIMSLTAITPSHTENLAMTAPVLNGAVGLIVRDDRRHEFQDWATIRKMDGLRVALANDSAARVLLAQLLPSADPVVYPDKKALDHLLSNGAEGVDVIGMFAEEGAAWTIRYPSFELVAPVPPVFVPVGYAVAHDNADMLTYLSAWLLNAKANGTIDARYRYWMLGQVRTTLPPRWSIIRDVLGWVD